MSDLDDAIARERLTAHALRDYTARWATVIEKAECLPFALADAVLKAMLGAAGVAGPQLSRDFEQRVADALNRLR